MKEALKLALAALDGGHLDRVYGYIQEALAQPDQFKPDYDTEAVFVEEMQRMAKRIEDLEAQPQRTWVGLTEEERSYYLQSASNVGWWQAVQFIEAKLKEKNT